MWCHAKHQKRIVVTSASLQLSRIGASILNNICLSSFNFNICLSYFSPSCSYYFFFNALHSLVKAPRFKAKQNTILIMFKGSSITRLFPKALSSLCVTINSMVQRKQRLGHNIRKLILPDIFSSDGDRLR